jgi:hypothetical protein
VARPVDFVVDWLFGLLGNLDTVLVVPVAWLTVGAIVYGHKLTPQEPPPLRKFKILAKVPRPIRRWSGELVSDLRDRFVALFGGFRQLAIAGLAPMLIFGLAFLASSRLQDGLDLLGRQLMGPQRLDTWLAFSPHVTTVTRAIGLTVTMCLLAAAVDRVLAAGSAAHPPAAGTEPPAQPVTATAT